MYERPVNTFIGRFPGEANLVEGTLQDVSSKGSALRIGDSLLLKAPATPAVLVGRKVNLFIRPERVAVSSQAAGALGPGINSVAGRVRRRSFLGNINRYVVAVGPTEITVDVGGVRFDIGDDVALTWAVADRLVLGS